MNFARDAGRIAANVNAWVADKTNGMISEILSEGSLNDRTLLVLLNAVYFKGEWNRTYIVICDEAISLSGNHVVLMYGTEGISI